MRTVNSGRKLVSPCGDYSFLDRCDVRFLSLSTGQMGKARRHRQGFWHCRGPQPSHTGHHPAMYLQLQEQLPDWWVRQFICQHFLSYFQCNTDLAFLWGKALRLLFFFLFVKTFCVIEVKVDVKILDKGFFLFCFVFFSSCIGQSRGHFFRIKSISRFFTSSGTDDYVKAVYTMTDMINVRLTNFPFHNNLIFSICKGLKYRKASQITHDKTGMIQLWPFKSGSNNV